MADSMQELLTCSICLDQFTNPKVLPCQHTFCLNCLRRIAANARIINCPTCREEHQIPDRNVANFKDNLVINNLLAMAEAGAGMELPARPKTKMTKECSDCRRKMSLSKCRHCGEMVCADCRASHVELAGEIKFLLGKTAKTPAADAPVEGEEMWKDLLNRIQNEQERLPVLFEQLQKKVDQRKEEITLYLDLMKRRLEHVLREEETPLERSVQERVSDCKTTSALRGLKHLLDSTEATMAAVLENEGRDKFSLLLESGVDAMGHVVYGGETIEIVGAGGATFPSPVKPGANKPDRRQRNAEPQKTVYEDKNTQVRDYIYNHPQPGQSLRPLFALYSELTDSIYCISEGGTQGHGQVLVYGMDGRGGTVLSPSVCDAHHLALTESGKIVIAESSTIAVVDVSDSSDVRRLGFPAISYPSQICALGNDLAILDPDRKRIFIYDEDYQLVREIEIKENVSKKSKMAVNDRYIYVTGSDVTVIRKDCGKKKGCPEHGAMKPSSVEVRVRIPIMVYSRTGDHVKTSNIDTPAAVYDYRFNTACGPQPPFGGKPSVRPANFAQMPEEKADFGGHLQNFQRPQMYLDHQFALLPCNRCCVRNDASVSDATIELNFTVRGLCSDGEGYVCMTYFTGGKNPAHHSVHVFSPQLEPLCQIKSATDGAPTAFCDPRGVSLTPDGRLVVCDHGNNRIQIL